MDDELDVEALLDASFAKQAEKKRSPSPDHDKKYEEGSENILKVLEDLQLKNIDEHISNSGPYIWVLTHKL